MLKDAAKLGQWLFFKNLHLVVSFLPMLEKEMKSIVPHENFRLCLTTEPHLEFPIVLLEQCVKVTYEAPPGIKRNLIRTYQQWSGSFIESGSPMQS